MTKPINNICNRIVYRYKLSVVKTHNQEGQIMPIQIMVKVVPSSGRSAWALDKSGALKCYLKSAPEKGLANRELIKNLSHALKIAQECIMIVGGVTSRNKRVMIQAPITLEEIMKRLGVEQQQALIK